MDDPSPPSLRPYDLLMRAVETHAAIRDGVPHVPVGLSQVARSSTTSATRGTGSRRAPRTRKKAG